MFFISPVRFLFHENLYNHACDCGDRHSVDNHVLYGKFFAFYTGNVFYQFLPDENWLDFIVSNRQNIDFSYNYDIVFGAVANDNVYASINLYEQGFLGKSELLEELVAWKYVDQFCFHSEKSLGYLHFIKSEEVF